MGLINLDPYLSRYSNYQILNTYIALEQLTTDKDLERNWTLHAMFKVYTSFDLRNTTQPIGSFQITISQVPNGTSDFALIAWNRLKEEFPNHTQC